MGASCAMFMRYLLHWRSPVILGKPQKAIILLLRHFHIASKSPSICQYPINHPHPPRWYPSTPGKAVISHYGPFSRCTTPGVWEPVLQAYSLISSSQAPRSTLLSTQPPPQLQNSFLPHWISSFIFALSSNPLFPVSIPSFILAEGSHF